MWNVEKLKKSIIQLWKFVKIYFHSGKYKQEDVKKKKKSGRSEVFNTVCKRVPEKHLFLLY